MPRARGSRGQYDHQKMVAHVVRHETKSRSKLREFLFFGAQDVIFRATRTVGMEHRIRRYAEELPTIFPEHDRRHAPSARCQADPLDSTSLCRSAASTPHWRSSMRPLLNSTGSFRQRGRRQRLVTDLHDSAARVRAYGRPIFEVLYIWYIYL